MKSNEIFNQIVSLSGLTIYAIAELSGINSSRLYDYKSGKKSPNLDTIIQILEALNMQITVTKIGNNPI